MAVARLPQADRETAPAAARKPRTTVEDRGQVPWAFSSALKANGITVTDDDITRVRGTAKREANSRWMPHGARFGKKPVSMPKGLRSYVSALWGGTLRSYSEARHAATPAFEHTRSIGLGGSQPAICRMPWLRR